MNRKIRKIIACTLTISALCTTSPVTNLFTVNAYASSTDGTKLKDINLNHGHINFSSSDHSYEVNVSQSIDEIEITALPKLSTSTVEIDGSTVDNCNGYAETVTLNNGKNTIDIKVIDTTNNKTDTYKLHVYRGSYDDDAYLNDLYLSDGYISFNKDNSSYYVSVDSSVDTMKITAKPEDEDDTVTISGYEVNEDDNYERKVTINKGMNTFEIKVKDESSDCEKVYTLNIFRGSSQNPSSTSNKRNQWVYVNGHMQYIDASGNPLKNTWFWDNSVKKYHFLNSSGYMHTGWLYYNSRWYYLNENGIMLTGWQYLNDSWYYLNYGGEMLTGWFKDKDGTWYYLDNNGNMLTGWIINNGKYYHLNNSGAMDYNELIDGFRLGSDGAWIGR